MDDLGVVEKIIGAIFGGIVLVIGAIGTFIKLTSGKKSPEEAPHPGPAPQAPPPSHSGGHMFSPHELIVALKSIEKGVSDLLQEQQEAAKADARESVYDAETRRLIADIATALQALVGQMELEKAVGQRHRDDQRQELRLVQEQLQKIRSSFREAISKLERIERRHSSRPSRP